MKKFKSKYLSFLIIALLLFGCNEDFLDLKPLALDSEETFYSTMDGADKAVTAIYSNFCLEKVWDLTIMMTLGSIASDEAEAGAGGKDDVIEFQHVDQFRHTTTEANVFIWPYGYLYRAINHANIAIEKIPLISKETDKDFNAAIAKRRLGEARFLRALNYFVLTQIFGGVPVFDHLPTPDEAKKGRDDISVAYDLIKSDLRYAISVLPGKGDYNSSNIGRASKGAAQALLAKVYLYESSYKRYYPESDERFNGMEEHWDSVAYFAEQVIDDDENYRLLGYDGQTFNTWWSETTGAYRALFMPVGNNCSETVFEIQNEQDGQAWFFTRGTALVRWCAPRWLENDDGEVVGHGWGWMCPSPQLVAEYEEGDPRFKYTVMESGDSIPDPTDGEGWVASNMDELYDDTGLEWHNRKYECSYEEYWQNSLTWQDGPLHVKLIRLADVMLWAAEAAMIQGDHATALDYINQIRTRARLSGEPIGDAPADYAAGTTVTLEMIMHERMVELALEGHRFFDLVRWNKAVEKLNAPYHTLADGDEIEFVPIQHDFFPIPASEIALSGNNLQNYEGWQ